MRTTLAMPTSAKRRPSLPATSNGATGSPFTTPTASRSTASIARGTLAR